MLFKINLLSAKGEAEGFHRHLIALYPRHFLDVLVAGGVHHGQTGPIGKNTTLSARRP